MERSIDELREEVAGLERAIEIFESRIETARSFVAMLQNTKVTKPGFAFWEWEHHNLPSKEASERLGAVLMALDARVARLGFAHGELGHERRVNRRGVRAGSDQLEQVGEHGSAEP